MAIDWLAKVREAEQRVRITEDGDHIVIALGDDSIRLTSFETRHLARRLSAAFHTADAGELAG